MNVEFTIKNYRCFDDSHPLKFTLENGFTAFVGSNNAGKSSIFKFFYELRPLWDLLARPLGNTIQLIRGKEENIFFEGVSDRVEVFCDTNNRPLTIEIKFSDQGQTNPWPIEKVIINICRPVSSPGQTEIKFKADFIVFDAPISNRDSVKEFVNNTQIRLHDDSTVDLITFFETFTTLKQIVYFPSFRNAINIGKGNYFDINIGTSFIEQWQDWSVGEIKARNIAIQRTIEDIQRIFKYDKLQIQVAKKLDTLQVTINGKPYKLQELGSGITQFILIFGTAAIKQPSFIMIDEPEVNLHPSLQLDFLTALASYSKNGILFATHSVGLARSVAERIYSVRRDGDSSIVTDFEQTRNLSEFMGELNFSSFKELGFDKILLVEGVSDVKTIQQFLRLLGKDHKVVLLPLGGGQLINGSPETNHELNELKRISKNIFALIDSEKESKNASLSKDRENFGKLCKDNGINLHILHRRAIENYFVNNAIEKVKGSKYKALAPYEKLKEKKIHWDKIKENWRIAHEMKGSDIENTDLYNFLEKI